MTQLFGSLMMILVVAGLAISQTSELTYQGRLVASGSAANTPHDFEFRLCAAVDSCMPPLEVKQRPAVEVTNGVFTVKLDFDEAQFNGADRWLEIAVRPAGGSTFTPLLPRQRVTSAPYSIRSFNSTQLGGVAAGQYVITTDSRMTDARAPLPGSDSYIQNSLVTSGPQNSSFNIAGSGAIGGTLTGNILNATTQFNLDGARVLGADSNNLFAGIGAGQANATGNQNSFFGRAAGASNTQGNGNSFFGAAAGNMNGTGSQNTLIGAFAGTGNIIGSNNTLLGADTSLSAGDLSFATAIGAGSIANANNTIVLGRAADAVQVPGNLSVAGTLSGNGSGLTGLPGIFKWQTVMGFTQQAQANNGYLVFNNVGAQATITLPSTLNIGDVVRVSAGEGSGGWRIAQNADQSVFLVGVITFQIWWTPRENVRSWSSIAGSNNLAKLVAVVRGGQIYTSADSGVTWTARESNRDWVSVTSSADGTKLAAVVNGGQIYTSSDSGVTWTPRDVGRVWSSIASSADGSKLVATEMSSGFGLPLPPGGIYTSTDSGVTWTERNPLDWEWSCVASSADGAKLVATRNPGLLYTSADSGITWTGRNLGGRWQSVASSSDGSKLAAAGDETLLWTSADSGATWLGRGPYIVWNAVASSADGSRLVAGGESGKIYFSIDSGATWMAMENDRNWSAMAISSDGTKVVATTRGGQIYTSTVPSHNFTRTTTPGTTGYIQGGELSSIELQYIGNGAFLPISYLGTITAR